MSETINLEEAATILKVSDATVRNWVKQEYLTPLKTSQKRKIFKRSEVVKLKEKINSGKIQRLKKRANKSQSTQTFIPDEYAENQEVIDSVRFLLEQYQLNKLDKECFLFAIILDLLKRKKLISFDKNLSNISCKNNFLKKEIDWWLEKTQASFNWKKYEDIVKLKNLPQTVDLLGVIYQSINQEGSKSKSGSYYTPKFIVEEIVNDCVKKNSKVVDPCCGTGRFLLSAAKKTANPEQVWGFDIDEFVVRIARINFFLEFPKIDFTPNIYCKNILANQTTVTLPSRRLSCSRPADSYNVDFDNIAINSPVSGGETHATTATETDGVTITKRILNIPTFDVVITNPPWGGQFSKTDKQKLNKQFPQITSGESFSYFLKTGLDLLKKGGTLSFILPEALLNIKTHKDIRKVILEKTKIKKIVLLERVFKNVFTPVFRLDLQKTQAKKQSKFLVRNGQQENKIKQDRFLNNSDYRFDILNSDLDIALFDKIYAVDHLTLKNKAEWALGIVTGNNKKFVSEAETLLTEPILTGKNIKRFTSNKAEKHIEFIPEHFQQVAPEYKYRAKEKLIYKFISKELVFSYDDKQTLTLNSANCLIPKLDYPIKTILALFNSSLYQFLYQKKFGSLKVLRGDIEELPLPKIDNTQHQNIENFANQLIKRNVSNDNKQIIYQELNEYIYDLFDLTSQNKNHIQNSIS